MATPILPAGSKLLVEFRAGRLLIQGTTAKPDTRKGLVRVLRTEDGLLHVEWWSREEASPAGPEFDEIVFPDEATFEQPPRAPPRVFMLKFAEQADRNAMFWMQEPSEAGDADLCAKVNRIINMPMGVDLEDLMADEPGVPEQMLRSDALLRGHTSNAPGAGEEVIGGDSVGLVPQGPGQQPMGAAQLAALLR
jgi:hypothetical protein